MRRPPLIALISATPTAIPPATEAITERIPDVRVWNIVDDCLLSDAADAGGVTRKLHERMERLISHSLLENPDAVLLTCSQYGQVARQTSATVPVMAPDDAAFELIISGGYSNVLVLASLKNAQADTVRRLSDAVTTAGSTLRIESRVVEEAAVHAANGDKANLARALTEASAGEFEAVFLAQYSLATVANELAKALGRPVISGPTAAAEAISFLLGENA